VRHGHGQVAPIHVDVHLGAADQLLPDQHPVLALHVRIPRIRGDRDRVRVGDGHGADGHEAQPQRPRRGNGGPPQGRDVGSEIGQPDMGRLFVSTTDRCSSEVNRPAGSCSRMLPACAASRRVARPTTWNSSSTPTATGAAGSRLGPQPIGVSIT
jgi:hypothetical protein